MNDMDVRCVKRVLRTAAASSALLFAAGPAVAGVLCREQPSRPHVSAALAPNWGFSQTCWQRFPAVASCDSGVGCATDSSGANQLNLHQGMIYAPQSGLMLPDQSLYSSPAG